MLSRFGYADLIARLYVYIYSENVSTQAITEDTRLKGIPQGYGRSTGRKL